MNDQGHGLTANHTKFKHYKEQVKKQGAVFAAEVTGDQKDRQGGYTHPSAEWIPQPGSTCNRASAHHTPLRITTSLQSCSKCGQLTIAGSGALLSEILGESWESVKTFQKKLTCFPEKKAKMHKVSIERPFTVACTTPGRQCSHNTHQPASY